MGDKGQQQKTTTQLIFFLWLLNPFKKLVNNRLVDHLEKCVLFSDFLYGFSSSWLTEDFLTVVSDRTDRAFDRSGTTQYIALEISNF